MCTAHLDWLALKRLSRSRFEPRQRQKYFSSSLCVQISPGAHPASCPVYTVGPFQGGKARSEGWRWPLTPIYCRGQEYVGAISPLPPSAFIACSGTAFFTDCFSLLLGKWKAKLRRLPLWERQIRDKSKCSFTFSLIFFLGPVPKNHGAN
jgi:hypothetical protein